METPYTKQVICICGEPVQQEGWGRPRLHCSDRCKQKAYRERQRVLREIQQERDFQRRLGAGFYGRQRKNVTKVN